MVSSVDSGINISVVRQRLEQITQIELAQLLCLFAQSCHCIDETCFLFKVEACNKVVSANYKNSTLAEFADLNFLSRLSNFLLSQLAVAKVLLKNSAEKIVSYVNKCTKVNFLESSKTLATLQPQNDLTIKAKKNGTFSGAVVTEKDGT